MSENKAYNRWNRSEARVIAKDLKKWFSADNKRTFKQASDFLNEAGVRHANAPSWTEKHVANFVYTRMPPARRKRKARTTTRSPKAAPIARALSPKNDRIELASLILSSNIGASNQERLIKTLFQ